MLRNLTLRSFAALSLLSVLCFAQEPTSSPDSATDTGKVAAKSAWLMLTPEQKTEVMHFADPYKDYLRHAKSAELSDAELVRLAHAAGFEDFISPAQVKPGARLILNNRHRSVLFAVIGADPIESGSRMVAAHEDSPHINLKARPVVNPRLRRPAQDHPLRRHQALSVVQPAYGARRPHRHHRWPPH